MWTCHYGKIQKIAPSDSRLQNSILITLIKKEPGSIQLAVLKESTQDWLADKKVKVCF